MFRIDNNIDESKTRLDTIKSLIDSKTQVQNQIKIDVQQLKDTQSEIIELTEISAKVNWECPVSTNPKYRLIEGTCYYFEATKMNYETAEINCKVSKFGPNKGRLVEPRSVSMNNKMYKNAQEVLSTVTYWIGVTDRRNEGRYSYNSDAGDANVNLGIWTRGEPNNTDGNVEGDCIVQQHSGKWRDKSCADDKSYTSICEMA